MKKASHEQNRTKVKIKNKLGLHARAAALFVKSAKKFHARVTVAKGSKKVDGKSIMNILMLAAGPGSVIEITAQGHDAREAVDELTELVLSRFGEI